MRDITPPHLRCAPGLSCPAVYERNEDILIVGKREHPQSHPHLNVGPDEEIVRIPREYLANVALLKCVEEDLL